ncbi:MAG: hypothetical protein JJU45_16420 [Acidimicrobiia bacterium]|nr:hypothetical protein [Acidimicrobiia bacterium]
MDTDPLARERVLDMETQFRDRLASMVAALPPAKSHLERFGTSPYVLLFYASQRGYVRLSEIEDDIVPAKVFSSMETSAGRMLEAVVLPFYGWECVTSSMHSPNSALDGRSTAQGSTQVATLKSGPRCLNDEMSENFADSIISHGAEWASHSASNTVEFTYGVLYGTKRRSNKKDWHILRKLAEKVPKEGGHVIDSPDGKWQMSFQLDAVTVTAAVRIGLGWWHYLGGDTCAVEVWTALVRACVEPGTSDPQGYQYSISDMQAIVGSVPANYNVSLLQASQIPWLMLTARHFCDDLVP